jgi:chromosome transmission fidelity protein 4
MNRNSSPPLKASYLLFLIQSKPPPTIPRKHVTEYSHRSPEFTYDCSAVWHTSGQHFFVASRAHGKVIRRFFAASWTYTVLLVEIVTISKSDWSKTSTLSDKDVTGAITALALSINGVYLASACHSKVYIWSTQTRRIIARYAAFILIPR